MSEQESPNVGVRLREFRHQRGLSLRALAELCELSPNTISLIERGTTSPSVSTLQRLALALGVHISDFFVDPGARTKLLLTRAEDRTRSGSSSVRLESLGYGHQVHRSIRQRWGLCRRYEEVDQGMRTRTCDLSGAGIGRQDSVKPFRQTSGRLTAACCAIPRQLLFRNQFRKRFEEPVRIGWPIRGV